MASGDTLLILPAHASTPPNANPATHDTFVGTGDTDGQVHRVLDFDPTTQEHADFVFVLPRHYAGGGVTVTIYWSSDATSGNVVWQSQFKSVTPDADDLDTKAFATAQEAAAAATASAAGEIIATTIAHTDGAQMDSVAVGELCALRINRDAADANDTMNSNDAELHAVEIKET